MLRASRLARFDDHIRLDSVRSRRLLIQTEMTRKRDLARVMVGSTVALSALAFVQPLSLALVPITVYKACQARREWTELERRLD